jgi:type IV secretion system protein VirB8
MSAVLDKAQEICASAKMGLGTKEEKNAMSADQLVDWYMKQAMAFEASKTEDARTSKKTAWRVASGSMVLAGVAIVVAGVNMFTNKPNPPAVWSHNSVTGEVTQLTTLKDGKVAFGKATDLFYLREYIKYRESYDWEQIQDYYNATLAMSSDQEGSQYKAESDPKNPDAPVNKFKDKVRVIAKAGTISFVGDTALVSYYKKTIPLDSAGDKPTIEYLQATVTFNYDNAPMKSEDRGVNVPGFKVTSFTKERDITRAAAVADPAKEGAR